MIAVNIFKEAVVYFFQENSRKVTLLPKMLLPTATCLALVLKLRFALQRKNAHTALVQNTEEVKVLRLVLKFMVFLNKKSPL